MRREFRFLRFRVLATLVILAFVAGVILFVHREASIGIAARGPASSYDNLVSHADLHSPEDDDEEPAGPRHRGDRPVAVTDESPVLSGPVFPGAVFTSAVPAKVDPIEVYNRTGLMGYRRARRLIFHEAEFLDAVRKRTVDLALFDDYQPRAQLFTPSPYAGNDGIFTGLLAHDRASTVRLVFQNGQLSGEISSAGHRIHIVSAGGHDNYVVEDEP